MPFIADGGMDARSVGIGQDEIASFTSTEKDLFLAEREVRIEIRSFHDRELSDLVLRRQIERHLERRSLQDDRVLLLHRLRHALHHVRI